MLIEKFEVVVDKKRETKLMGFIFLFIYYPIPSSQ